MRSLICVSFMVLFAGPCLAQEAAVPPVQGSGQPAAATPPGDGVPLPARKGQPATEQAFLARREAALMRADTDKDGRISQAEWLAYSAERGTKGRPERQFARLDLNHDGYLDKSEIDAMLAHRFAKMDSNGDGLLTADERRHRKAPKP